MNINTTKNLEKEINKRVKNAIGWITEEVYNKLLYFIQVDIYDTYTPTKYKRTGEFKNNAWDKTFLDFSDEVAGIIFYNPMAMSYNPNEYQHGNATEDRRERLAQILNRGVWNWEGWDFGRPEKDNIDSVYPKAFWDDTLDWLAENWEKLAKKAFSKVGIKLKK